MRPTLADRSFTFASPAIQEQPGDSPVCCVCLGRHFNVFLMFFYYYYYFLFINYDLFSLRFLALKA